MCVRVSFSFPLSARLIFPPLISMCAQRISYFIECAREGALRTKAAALELPVRKVYVCSPLPLSLTLFLSLSHALYDVLMGGKHFVSSIDFYALFMGGSLQVGHLTAKQPARVREHTTYYILLTI